jgi:D-methionine transport system ATP-binding protein
MSELSLTQINLTTVIGKHHLLKDINFHLKAGTRLGLVGPSGAGKTSLLRLLNKLTSPTSGDIVLNGENYRNIPAVNLRQRVALLMQESHLLGMTVQEAIAYPLTLRSLPPAEINQRLEYWREQLNISSEWLDKTELQLSVGQRQLVAIARCLVTQSEVILLDEPTSALDRGKTENLLRVLTEISQGGTIIIMVNHQLDIVKQFATDVIYLQEGEIHQNMVADRLNWQGLQNSLIEAEKQDAMDFT